MNTKNAVWGTIALVGLGAGGWVWTHRASGAEITYKTATITKGDLRQTVSATGTVQPFTVVDIKSRAGGEVKVLPVEVGDRIKAGALIASIDPTDSQTTYDQARADVDAGQARISQAEQNLALQAITAENAIAQAQSAINAAKARLIQAQATAKSQPAITNAAVAQSKASLNTSLQSLAQLKSGTDPQARADAKASYNSAKANLTNAELQLNRQKQLVAKGFVAQSTVDAAQAAYDVARANANSAKARADTVGDAQEASIAAAESRVTESRASLRSAEANRVQISLRNQDVTNAQATLNQARIALQTAYANKAQIGIRAADVRTAKAQIARSQAALTNAKIVLDLTTIRAPRDGVILQKYVEQGTIITSGQSFNSSGTSIVQLGDLSRVLVDAAVDEADVAQVSVGQTVKVTLDALPDKDFEGRVRRIDPRGTSDQNVTTIRTQIELLHPDSASLRVGLNAECEFLVREKKNVLIAPTRAIKNDKGKKTAQVLPPKAKDSTVQPPPTAREVKTGLEIGDQVEITDGLKEGDKVVTATIKPGEGGGGAGKGGGKGGPPGGGKGGPPGGGGGGRGGR